MLTATVHVEGPGLTLTAGAVANAQAELDSWGEFSDDTKMSISCHLRPRMFAFQVYGDPATLVIVSRIAPLASGV